MTLGSWAGSRTAALPDVPTMKEQGFDVEFYIWAGVFAPAGLPPDVRRRGSARRSAQSVQDPEFQTAMANVNTPINFLEGAEFDAVRGRRHEAARRGGAARWARRVAT